jgi:hypothetical protein
VVIGASGLLFDKLVRAPYPADPSTSTEGRDAAFRAATN